MKALQRIVLKQFKHIKLEADWKSIFGSENEDSFTVVNKKRRHHLRPKTNIWVLQLYNFNTAYMFNSKCATIFIYLFCIQFFCEKLNYHFKTQNNVGSKNGRPITPYILLSKLKQLLTAIYNLKVNLEKNSHNKSIAYDQLFSHWFNSDQSHAWPWVHDSCVERPDRSRLVSSRCSWDWRNCTNKYW